MGNILRTEDIIEAINKIDEDCTFEKKFTHHGVEHGASDTKDYKQFYERIRGMVSLIETNVVKKGGGFNG